MSKCIRLDKYLADMGLGTRTEVKEYIKKGKITVDGLVIKKPEQKINANEQKICMEGKQIVYEEWEYYMLNKPAGVVSAVSDAREKTVIDLITTTKRKDLFPVGRLDKDTEGLLLITNDGKLSHSLLSPKKHVDKTYYAKIDGMITEKEIEQFAKGICLKEESKREKRKGTEGIFTLPAKLKILSSADCSEVEITIQEGKYHQVKRMFEAVGTKVIYLKRLAMGNLVLDKALRPGEYRPLTEEEVEQLKNRSAYVKE
ncbi:pseudouridine synthase [Velocimicrobium porci]|uniref:Pseudouridine synthase n=1 Tax=Velocimicrobium porci TaxID=2606634 RepID=A0A6L5XZP4_9FIRM|nr:pseudouridine synthase [Velocimicrobium porci]MSS64047.1 rRNA pseudouridine synthase [Velocimicrobium porci]